MAEAGLWLAIAIVAGALPLGGWIVWRALRRIDRELARMHDRGWL